MKLNKILRRAGIFLSLFALVTMVSLPTLAKSTKAKRPTVAIIRADWCSACQKLEPTMMGLISQYKDRIDFVMLDVTDDQKTTQAASEARKLGLGSSSQRIRRRPLRSLCSARLIRFSFKRCRTSTARLT